MKEFSLKARENSGTIRSKKCTAGKSEECDLDFSQLQGGEGTGTGRPRMC